MARTFNGSTDVAVVGDAAAIDITGTALTIAAWVKVASLSTRSVPVSKQGASGAFQYELRVNQTTGTVGFIIDDGTSAFNSATTSGGVTAGTWAHIAGRKNGTGAGAIAAFLNATANTATSNQSIQNTASPLWLGSGRSSAGAVSNVLNGDLAEVAIWDAALGDDEITALSKGISPALIRPQSLRGHWPLIGRASPEPDLRNANAATLTGTSAANHPRIYNPTRGQVGRRRSTTYTQALAGTLTSAGTLAKQARKIAAGTLTSSGALARRTGKALGGTLTSSGALTRQTGKAPAGTLTGSGGLARRMGKALAGTLSSSGGVLKQIATRVAGALASSGTLAGVRLFLKAIGGTLTSSGTLSRRTGKGASGTLSSSGAVLKRTAKVVAGTLSSSGALAVVRVFLKIVGGALAPSGALARRTGKALGGTLAPSGALARRTGKALVGTLTSSGALIKRAAKVLSGTLTSSGSVASSRLIAWLRHIFRILADDRSSVARLGSSFPVAEDDHTSEA